MRCTEMKSKKCSKRLAVKLSRKAGTQGRLLQREYLCDQNAKGKTLNASKVVIN